MGRRLEDYPRMETFGKCHRLGTFHAVTKDQTKAWCKQHLFRLSASRIRVVNRHRKPERGLKLGLASYLEAFGALHRIDKIATPQNIRRARILCDKCRINTRLLA